jgi:hypothetical protein
MCKLPTLLIILMGVCTRGGSLGAIVDVFVYGTETARLWIDLLFLTKNKLIHFETFLQVFTVPQ